MRAADLLLDLLFPPKCPFCGTLLEKGALLCPECQRSLPWLSGAAGETAVELTGGCVSPLRYEGKVREGIRGYKFGGRSARSGTFGTLIAQCVRDRGLTADVAVWPPLGKKRLKERGYDQAELLARRAAEELGLPVAGALRKEDRPEQSGIHGEAERRANLLGAYTAADPGAVAGKRVLLIDDVVTTGATLSECAKVLRIAGAAEVVCATLAKAGK